MTYQFEVKKYAIDGTTCGRLAGIDTIWNVIQTTNDDNDTHNYHTGLPTVLGGADGDKVWMLPRGPLPCDGVLGGGADGGTGVP